MIKYKLISIEYDYVSTSSKVVLSQKNFLKTGDTGIREKSMKEFQSSKKEMVKQLIPE